MLEKKVVFDFHHTLVDKRGFFIRREGWMPGRVELLEELGLMGWSFAVWTADLAHRLENTNLILTPALLGLARRGFTDEYYAVDRPPKIPDGFDIPYSRGEIFEYVHHMAPLSSHNPMIDEASQSIGGVHYDQHEDYIEEVKRCLLRHNMRHGHKIPTLIGSRVLVDDLVNSQYIESERLKINSQLFGFSLVDPKRKGTDRRWANRIAQEIMDAF